MTIVKARVVRTTVALAFVGKAEWGGVGPTYMVIGEII